MELKLIFLCVNFVYANAQCLNKIFNQKKGILIIDPHNQIEFNFMRHEIIYFTEVHEFTTEIQHILLYLETENDLLNVIKQLKNTKGWKSKHYHYIFYPKHETQTTKIFQILWDYFIYNIVLIIDNNVFTYFPFNGGVCNNTTLIKQGKCDEIVGFFPENPAKIPNNLHQCEYKILALQRPPFVLNILNSNEDKSRLEGFEVTMMNNIARKLNISLKYIYNPYKDFGVLQTNGTFTEMFGLLQAKKADIIYGGFHYGYIASHYFDITVTHKIVNSAWFVPAPLAIPKWQNVLIVFEVKVWILILTTLAIKTIYWFTVSRQSFDYCFLYVWSMFLLVSIKHPPNNILKIQFYICTVSFVIITTAYVSKLIGVLTKPIYEKSITNVDELLESNLKIGFHPAYTSRLNDSKYKFLLDNYVKCSPGYECMNQTAFKRDLAVIKLDVQTFYMIPRVYTTPSGRPMLNWFNEVIGHSHLGFYVLRGLPILERINDVVFQLIEGGFVNKWEDDVKYVTRKEASEMLNALSLRDLQTPFYVLLFGTCISFIVFFIEMLCSLLEINNK